MKHTTYTIPVLWVLLSTGLFTIIFAAAKIGGGQVGAFQLLLLRYVGGLCTLLCLACWQGGVQQFRSARTWSHFARALFGSGAAAAITWASARMPLAEASALAMLYGALSVGLGVVILKERLRFGQILAVLATLLGAGIVVAGRGGFQSGLPALPSLAAVLSAGLLAFEGLLIQRLSRAEPALTVMLYVGVFGIVLMAIPAALDWHALSLRGWVLCIGLGPVAVFAQYCTIRGYRAAPLSVVGPVDYSWLVFAALLGFVAFGETPSVSLYLGGGLIMVGGIQLARSKAVTREPSHDDTTAS